MNKFVLSVLLVIAVVSGIGCQKNISRPEKSTSLQIWPVYKNNDEVKILDNYWTRKEDGNAAIIVRWDNWFKYDKENNLLEKKTDTAIWPVYSVQITENQKSVTSKGTIAIVFNFDETKTKKAQTP